MICQLMTFDDYENDLKQPWEITAHKPGDLRRSPHVLAVVLARAPSEAFRTARAEGRRHYNALRDAEANGLHLSANMVEEVARSMWLCTGRDYEEYGIFSRTWLAVGPYGERVSCTASVAVDRGNSYPGDRRYMVEFDEDPLSIELNEYNIDEGSAYEIAEERGPRSIREALDELTTHKEAQA